MTNRNVSIESDYAGMMETATRRKFMINSLLTYKTIHMVKV